MKIFPRNVLLGDVLYRMKPETTNHIVILQTVIFSTDFNQRFGKSEACTSPITAIAYGRATNQTGYGILHHLIRTVSVSVPYEKECFQYLTYWLRYLVVMMISALFEAIVSQEVTVFRLRYRFPSGVSW